MKTVSQIVSLAALIATLLASGAGLAQEKHKYYFKAPPGVTKYTQQQTIDVGDVPGHQIRIAQLHSKYTDPAPSYDGVKVREAMGYLSSDYVNGSGRFTQYGVAQMENGDRLFQRSEALAQTSVAADGSRKASFATVTTLAGGTGKFAAIRGVLRSTGFTDFKTGTSDTVTEGEYWFEK